MPIKSLKSFKKKNERIRNPQKEKSKKKRSKKRGSSFFYKKGKDVIKSVSSYLGYDSTRPPADHSTQNTSGSVGASAGTVGASASATPRASAGSVGASASATPRASASATPRASAGYATPRASAGYTPHEYSTEYTQYLNDISRYLNTRIKLFRSNEINYGEIQQDITLLDKQIQNYPIIENLKIQFISNIEKIRLQKLRKVSTIPKHKSNIKHKSKIEQIRDEIVQELLMDKKVFNWVKINILVGLKISQKNKIGQTPKISLEAEEQDKLTTDIYTLYTQKQKSTTQKQKSTTQKQKSTTQIWINFLNKQKKSSYKIIEIPPNIWKSININLSKSFSIPKKCIDKLLQPYFLNMLPCNGDTRDEVIKIIIGILTKCSSDGQNTQFAMVSAPSVPIEYLMARAPSAPTSKPTMSKRVRVNPLAEPP